ncbi:MAG: thermonuclease family protein [Magnetospiraceae bacterium]
MRPRFPSLFFASLMASLLVRPVDGVELASVERVPAEVIKVIDGDSIRVDAMPWPGFRVTTIVRLRGVDTPELRGKCSAEKRMAQKARDFVQRQVASGPVVLTDIDQGKYAGRVVARVQTADGADIGAALLKAGLAREYKGKARRSWCNG